MEGEMGQTPGAHRVRQDCTCTACGDTKALARDVARLTRERDEARAEVGRLREIALRTIDIMMEQESSHLNDPGVLGAYSILREVLAEALAAGEPGEEQS